ncbi:MAG: hypothetical protein AB7J63_06600 [Vicinamibacterales bacterium]
MAHRPVVEAERRAGREMSIKTFHLTNAYHDTSGGVRTFYQNLLAAAERRRQPLRLLVPGSRTEVEDVGSFGRI